jgi:Fur family transcriptional regulator, peroxide stress response regulator
MNREKHKLDLKTIKLKITPQRLAVLEALVDLKNHPTAEKIKEHVIKNHPNIAVGTIYKTLETFVEKGIVKKVKSEKDIMRYDAVLEKHHHLYGDRTEEIADYFDNELDEMLEKYFKSKKIPNFHVKEIKLQINGTFLSKKKK